MSNINTVSVKITLCWINKSLLNYKLYLQIEQHSMCFNYWFILNYLCILLFYIIVDQVFSNKSFVNWLFKIKYVIFWNIFTLKSLNVSYKNKNYLLTRYSTRFFKTSNKEHDFCVVNLCTIWKCLRLKWILKCDDPIT